MKCDVVTLSNGKEYTLLLEKEFENKIYYLAELNGNDEINGDSLFFEKNIKDNREFLKLVTNKELIEKLLILFTADYIKIAENLGGNI